MDDQVLSQLTGIPVQQIATYNNMQKQQLINMAQSKLPKINATQQQNTPIIKQKEYKFDKNAGRAKNDMSAVEDFKQAFRQARQEGNKTFFWKKTKANPSGMFSTELASSKKPVNEKSTDKYENVTDESIEVPLEKVQITRQIPMGIQSLTEVQQQPLPMLAGGVNRTPPTFFGKPYIFNKQAAINEDWKKSGFSRPTITNPGNSMPFMTKTFADGGKIDNIVNQIITAIIQGDSRVFEMFNQLGPEGEAQIKTLIKEKASKGDEAAIQANAILNNQTQVAKLGTKLDYLNKLKGICPEGSEKVYMAKGGCMCKQKALKGDKVVEPNDTIHYNKKVYDLTGKHKQYKPLTNKDYRNLPTNKQADVDNKDMMRAKDKKAEKKACGGKSNTLMKKKK